MGRNGERTGPDTNDSSPPEGAVGRPSRLRWILSPTGLTSLVIATFVVVGGYARLADLGGVSLWTDEAQTTLLAFSVLHHGYPIITSAYLLNNWEPLYPYFEAASIAVLGQSNFADRLPSALLGTALIPLAYLVGARIRDRYVGIGLAAMVAFSTEYIAWSRQARWYILLVFLLVLALLAAAVWTRSRNPRTRRLCVGAFVVALVAAATASIGVFLLYAPAILVGGIAYVAAVRWDRVRHFFRGPDTGTPGPGSPPSPRVPYRYRLWLLTLVLAAAVLLILLELPALSQLEIDVTSRVLFVRTFPLTWTYLYGTYLVEFYPAIVALSLASIFFVAQRRDPLEIALLFFCGAAFVGVSVGASITTPIAYGTFPDERHIVPLLFFLFLLSAISIVGIVRWCVSAVARRWPEPRQLRRAAPALFGVAIVVMLVVPSAAIPTSNHLAINKIDSPEDSLLPWVAFSVDPQTPWALYRTPQSNYQLASDYVLSHRAPGDVVAADRPGPPAVYLGSVQYWVRGNPVSEVIYVGGVPEYFQTGSRLIGNASELVPLLLQDTGWLISDVPPFDNVLYQAGLSGLLTTFMTLVPGGSDVSIWLLHWNRSSPQGLLETLIHESTVLNETLGNMSLQVQLTWAVTRGVLVSGDRAPLIPVVPYLLPLVTSHSTLGLGVLFNLYDNRPDLEAMFPDLTQAPFNDTAILHWGCAVASGSLPDPAYPALAPFESVYCA